jgi:hypothetical protein
MSSPPHLLQNKNIEKRKMMMLALGTSGILSLPTVSPPGRISSTTIL